MNATVETRECCPVRMGWSPHCWHALPYRLLVYPAIQPERCCFCGARRSVQEDARPPGAHGPYLPNAPGIAA